MVKEIDISADEMFRLSFSAFGSYVMYVSILVIDKICEQQTEELETIR